MSDGHLLGKSRLESVLGVEVSQYTYKASLMFFMLF